MFYRNKVQPVPPRMPREIAVGPTKGRKFLKWFLVIFLAGVLGIGLWIGYVANRAIGKITDNDGKKSNIFSFLGDFDVNNLKGKSQGRTNILILGMGGANHPGGTLSDTMIVLSLDYSSKKIGMISVPRDLWVPIPGFGSAKINEAYADGEKSKKTTGGGGPLSARTVENVLGIPINYWVALDFEGFKDTIDSVGGIDVDVPKAISDPYYPAPDMIHYQPFSISAGPHHMNGDLALKYARSRETTSDFDRSHRQELVIKATYDKVTTLGFIANPVKLTDLLNTLGSHLRTSMQVSDVKSFLTILKDFDTKNIINKVLDTSVGGPLTQSQDSRGYYIYPRKGITDFSELQAIAKNLFNQDFSAPASIQILNGTSQSGLAESLSDELKASNYSVSKIGNTQVSTKTYVYYCSGSFTSIAQSLASQVGGSALSKQACPQGVDIQIILGKDFIKR